MIWSLLTIFLISLSSNITAKDWEFQDLANKVGYHSYWSHPNLTFDEKRALQSYKSIGYSLINDGLRTGDIDDVVDRVIRRIDSAFSKTQLLPKDVLLYRGYTLGFRENQTYLIDEEFTDKAFSSSSLNISVSRAFAKSNNGDKGVVLLIYSNQEYLGMLISNLEEEILFPRGSKFRVMRTAEVDNFQYVLTQNCEVECLDIIPDYAQQRWLDIIK